MVIMVLPCFWQQLFCFLVIISIIIIIVLQILDMQYGILKGACHMYYGTTMVSKNYHCSTMLFLISVSIRP